uniref:Uncharacterized protein n=1 Tax=viral metagenome TaxID=1070528 RepID=A0A6M3MAE3_9ZZZZ
MVDYLVTWEIDIEAETPREAAVIARNIQIDPESYAKFFKVTEPKSKVPSSFEDQKVHFINLDIPEK